MKKINYEGKELYLPIYDLIFKAIFGDENDKDLLAAFIRDVLDIPVESGEDLEICNTELVPDAYDGKLARVDVRARLSDGRMVHIEMQVWDKKDTVQKSVIYNSKMLGEQISRGDKYLDAAPVITLVITDFALFKNTEQWYNTFKLANIETGGVLTDLVRISYIELPKFKRCPKDMPKLSNKEKWAMFLSAKDEEVLKMLASTDKNIEKAVNKLKYISDDENIRFALEQREVGEWEYNYDMHHAEKRGREQKAVETAKKLKASGVDFEIIADSTGLTLEQIKDL